MSVPNVSILQGNALEVLRTLPDESVHCCVTSPPYWGLRDYGTAKWEGGSNDCDHQVPIGRKGGNAIGTKQTTNPGSYGYREWLVCGKCGAKRVDPQLGLEKTPEEYVEKMVAVFREVRRVLREDGTLWLNMGDSYVSAPAGNFGHDMPAPADGGRYRENKPKMDYGGLKPKDLCGIPWRLAFALQADGWWLRQDIIWAKPNPMPESVTDRCTKAHEYVFLLAKRERYFYDAEAVKEPSEAPGSVHVSADRQKYPGTIQLAPNHDIISNGTRNRRSVWTINSEPYPEAHFATFPTALVKPCILAGTSARGCCPKCGGPWERVVEKSGGTIGKGSWVDHANDAQQGLGQRTGSRRNGEDDDGSYTVRTTGWHPTCDCGESAFVPCTVLDPFGGSGTTGLVALENGRSAILIELNPQYIELARNRCHVTPSLSLA